MAKSIKYIERTQANLSDEDFLKIFLSWFYKKELVNDFFSVECHLFVVHELFCKKNNFKQLLDFEVSLFGAYLYCVSLENMLDSFEENGLIVCSDLIKVNDFKINSCYKKELYKLIDNVNKVLVNVDSSNANLEIALEIYYRLHGYGGYQINYSAEQVRDYTALLYKHQTEENIRSIVQLLIDLKLIQDWSNDERSIPC